MSTNPFAIVVKHKALFKTPKGMLTVEQVYDVPLTSTGLSLEDIAQTCATEVQKLSTGGNKFVSKAKPAKGLQLAKAKLEVVIYIIADKEAAEERLRKQQSNATKRAKLLGALEASDNKAIGEMSREELLKQLRQIDEA